MSTTFSATQRIAAAKMALLLLWGLLANLQNSSALVFPSQTTQIIKLQQRTSPFHSSTVGSSWTRTTTTRSLFPTDNDVRQDVSVDGSTSRTEKWRSRRRSTMLLSSPSPAPSRWGRRMLGPRLVPTRIGRSSFILRATEKNNEGDNVEKKPAAPLASLLSEIRGRWTTSVSTLEKAIPEPVLKFLQWISEALDRIKWLLVSFTAGAVLSVTALLLPLYDTMQPVTQPVTLFETILSDLDQAYVEPVDTNKLFETGVAAMLRSLDPYTEFEGIQEAQQMTESIEGKYGGVGLVIAGIPDSARPKRTAPAKPVIEKIAPDQPVTTPPSPDGLATPISSSNPATSSTSPTTITVALDDYDEEDLDADADDFDDSYQTRRENRKRLLQMQNKGIRVVSAFEGYAFDYGMRVGDRLVAVDDVVIDASSTTIEDVRNTLRGEPGTLVTIQFERDGVEGVQSVTMPRSVVRIRDVKLATLLGNPRDGIGYIQLAGFASDAGREMRQAIQYLQRAAQDASDGQHSLQGLVLDLRGNPGGLLTSAVDVASQLVPKGSDIVSARGRGFPGLAYRSRGDPILDTSQTKLAVLVNSNTASAAEIVSGAVQDLDVGIIVGQDRTFGKGLVQNVEELPYNTALKFTIAKYYTPSGRCIQGIKYTEGGGLKSETDGRYVASKISEKDRGIFYTRTGRIVRDGGGIEADYKVPSAKTSALEMTLLRAGVFSDFAAEWSKKHELTHNFDVDGDTYKSFQAFVNEKQKSGELQLEALYERPLADLKKALKASGYKGSEKNVEQLQARIVHDIQSDFEKYRNDIKEDISQNILARYLPESMLIERGVQKDGQVQAAAKLLGQRNAFDKILAKGSAMERKTGEALADGSATSSSMNVARNTGAQNDDGIIEGFRATIAW